MKKASKSSPRRKKTPPEAVSQVGTGIHVAKLFKNGRSQAMRIPRAFRFPGDAVYLKRTPAGVLIISKLDPWAGLKAAYGSIPNFPDIEKLRNQERPELEGLAD